MLSIQQPKPLYEQAYDIVRTWILNGEMKPGSKIVMAQLAEKLAISRTPLRDALRKLQNEGLLDVDCSGVITVIQTDRSDFDELCECRLTLERQIIEFVTLHITDKQLDDVEKVLIAAEQANSSENHMEVLQLHAQFHERLVGACPNKRILQLLRQIRSLLLIYRANIHQYTDHNVEISREHRRIFHAVNSRNIQESMRAVEAHLKNDRQRGRKMFETNGT